MKETIKTTLINLAEKGIYLEYSDFDLIEDRYLRLKNIFTWLIEDLLDSPIKKKRVHKIIEKDEFWNA